jgi:hypothetical protein
MFSLRHVNPSDLQVLPQFHGCHNRRWQFACLPQAPRLQLPSQRQYSTDAHSRLSHAYRLESVVSSPTFYRGDQCCHVPCGPFQALRYSPVFEGDHPTKR